MVPLISQRTCRKHFSHFVKSLVDFLKIFLNQRHLSNMIRTLHKLQFVLTKMKTLGPTNVFLRAKRGRRPSGVSRIGLKKKKMDEKKRYHDDHDDHDVFCTPPCLVREKSEKNCFSLVLKNFPIFHIKVLWTEKKF